MTQVPKIQKPEELAASMVPTRYILTSDAFTQGIKHRDAQIIAWAEAEIAKPCECGGTFCGRCAVLRDLIEALKP